MAIRFPRGTTFTDRLVGPLPRFGDVLRFMWTYEVPRRSELDPLLVPVSHAPLPAIGPRQAALTWIGHATYLLRVAGTGVVIDPVWSRRIPGVPRRLSEPGLEFARLPPVDVVLISHDHYDHLDAPTIERFPRDVAVLVPLGLGSWFTARGFTAVTEFDWWESARIGALRFDFVPARHWSRRGPTDFCRSLWGGWLVTAPNGLRFYHAGDTGYGRHFERIGRAYPDIDVAMLPIGAYHPTRVMRPVHLTPEDAVTAALDLGASRLASMHWATFPLTREPVLQPLERLRVAWFRAGGTSERLWDMAVGETRTLRS